MRMITRVSVAAIAIALVGFVLAIALSIRAIGDWDSGRTLEPGAAVELDPTEARHWRVMADSTFGELDRVTITTLRAGITPSEIEGVEFVVSSTNFQKSAGSRTWHALYDVWIADDVQEPVRIRVGFEPTLTPRGVTVEIQPAGGVWQLLAGILLGTGSTFLCLAGVAGLVVPRAIGLLQPKSCS